MFKKKEINYAVVFQEVYIEKLGYSIFLPKAPVVGYTDEKKTTFVDILSGVKYINIEQAMELGLHVSFGILTPLKKLKKSSTKHGFEEDYLVKIYNAMEDLVYFYKEGKFVSMFRDSFEDENALSLDNLVMSVETINGMTNSLMDGSISAHDYNETIYGFDRPVIRSNGNNDIKVVMDSSIREVYDKVRANVISQDEAIKRILTSIYKSRMFKGKVKKSNILVIGPTGVGKTEIFRTINQVMDIPVIIEDMTRYTETGYVGSSVDDILRNLYLNSDEDLEKAENSILVLDEIDKKASNCVGRNDFNKGDVLKSLLKIIEGGVFEIDIARGQTISFDTSNLIIVAAGAFSSLYDSMSSNMIGFNRVKENSSKNINNSVLENYGMPIEFLGRFGSVVRMNSLTREDFISIMKNSDLSAIKEYINEFRNLGIDLCISEDMYERIADLAFSMGVGARAINSVVDSIFEEILFEVFEDSQNIDKIELGEDIVNNHKDYVLRKKN